MKSKIKTSILCLLLIILLGCKKKYPIITFEATTIDIGKIKHNDSLGVTFKFKNVGNEVLRTERIITDCQCTLVNGFQKNIEPNQSGEININFHSKGLGYFEQLIQVFSNDEKGSALLILKGQSIP